jgi:NADPH2:quinone reductase
VIGTVSSEEKAALARGAGADHIVIYTREDTARRVRELTGGAGVRVVFDGVGLDTWEASLDSTGRRGLIVSYGNASAPVTGVNLGILASKGSLYSTRPTLFDYYADPAEREAGAARLWQMIRAGKVKVTIGQTYPLDQAEQAHRDLESRATNGSTLLLP